MKILTGLISSLTLLSLNVVGLSQVQAQTQGFEFQNVPVTFTGNGCPQGTFQAVFNRDTLSITFSEFEAKPSRNVASCNLRSGLIVPSGFNLQPISIKYTGFADVPNGGSADLNVKILFQGREVATTNNPSRTFPAGFLDVWSKDLGLVLNPINACKNPVSSVFGINSALALTPRVTNIPLGQQTKIRIDTLDITLAFNPC
ncbi:DUF4360 domain-containing protein [Nostoc sp. XA010]|uniref:DUF4360 domain-containing protein n=1 Tax=Nostoc sp. XA010 TaxID=2780407 RepID=UPI001E5612BC|nr:DUF4360 domain-containing protein [Nostoc sp. XA010]MCC5656554.1 DUF4360 domain-containing protein [Nostoc sp. XA010]